MSVKKALSLSVFVIAFSIIRGLRFKFFSTTVRYTVNRIPQISQATRIPSCPRIPIQIASCYKLLLLSEKIRSRTAVLK